MKRVLIAFLFYFSLAFPCFGNNCYFIPGDAFFYFEIDKAEFESLQKGNFSIVNYDRPASLSTTFCGYAGYQTLDIGNLPGEYRTKLVNAISRIKKKFPTKTVEVETELSGLFGGPPTLEKKEINKIRIFVYNKSFDFTKHRVALKYNESWANAGVKLGFPKDHFRYEFFVASPKGIVESWRDASDVKPLKLTMPELPKAFTDKPMKSDPAEIKFLVCPPVPLNELCYPKGESGLECFSVSKEGMTKLTVGKSNWVETAILPQK